MFYYQHFLDIEMAIIWRSFVTFPHHRFVYYPEHDYFLSDGILHFKYSCNYNFVNSYFFKYWFFQKIMLKHNLFNRNMKDLIKAYKIVDAFENKSLNRILRIRNIRRKANFLNYFISNDLKKLPKSIKLAFINKFWNLKIIQNEFWIRRFNIFDFKTFLYYRFIFDQKNLTHKYRFVKKILRDFLRN